MDGSQFDQLLKEMASTPSRRTVVKAALATVFGGAIGRFGLQGASAATQRQVGETCRATSECFAGACDIGSDGRRRCVCTTPTVATVPNSGYSSTANSSGFPIPVLDGYETYPDFGGGNIKQTCLGGVCPVIKFCDRSVWVYSFVDNRTSYELVGYDAAGNVVGVTEKPGDRYITSISVNSQTKTVTLYGQSGAVQVSFAELRSLAGVS